jgi:8-oxo-dGTP diphosphatase
MVEGVPEFGEKLPGADYIFRAGGYLIVSNSRGEIAVVFTPQGFFLPGGGQDGGETPAQAAVRETAEECGLHVQLGGLIGTADELVFAPSEGKYYRKRCAFFRAELVECAADGEADHQLVWLTAAQAARRLCHRSQVWAVSRASRLTKG